MTSPSVLVQLKGQTVINDGTDTSPAEQVLSAPRADGEPSQNYVIIPSNHTFLHVQVDDSVT